MSIAVIGVHPFDKKTKDIKKEALDSWKECETLVAKGRLGISAVYGYMDLPANPVTGLIGWVEEAGGPKAIGKTAAEYRKLIKAAHVQPLVGIWKFFETLAKRGQLRPYHFVEYDFAQKVRGVGGLSHIGKTKEDSRKLRNFSKLSGQEQRSKYLSQGFIIQ